VLFTVNVIHGRTQYDDSLVNSPCHEIQVQIVNSLKKKGSNSKQENNSGKKGDYMQCIKDA
jgi:hypothetical protein